MNTSNVWSGRCRQLIMAIVLLGAVSGGLAASQIDKVASANVDFAFKLLKEVVAEQPDRNVLISPYGVSSALQMAATGARGQTKVEMERVLGTGGLPTNLVNEANRDFDRMLNGKGTNVTLSVANAIWCKKGAQIKPDFVASCRDYFGARVDELDFSDAQSADIINTWASERTHGRISSIADGTIRPRTELFLANAVYFKGKWEQPFGAILTTNRVFHLRTGQQKQVTMMEQMRSFDYRIGIGYQAVRLEYADLAMGMYVFLPDPDSSLEKLVSNMTGDTWQREIATGFNRMEGMVVLPKFKMEYGVDLNRTLMALGMKTAFGKADMKADFTGICDDDLPVTTVSQKTFIEVGEEGTEAAAVTGIGLTLGASQSKRFLMVVDRPFLFLIEDKQTKAILFMGVVVEPKG